MNRHIMLDLETLSTRSHAVIIAIGAVLINVRANEIESEFYMRINLDSAVGGGGDVDGSTIEWWLDQARAARNELIGNTTSLHEALAGFDGWMENNYTKEMGVWGNGAAADNVWLRNAFTKAGMEVPWNFRQDRCYRTLNTLHKNIAKDETLRENVSHNALHDARRQALHLSKILNETGHEYTTTTS